MSKKSAASPTPLSCMSVVKRRKAQHQSQSAPSRHSREHKVSLEKIVGLTCVNSNALSVSVESGCVAYPAGCVAVLQLPKKNRQLHILNTSKKPISCVCLSADGKYLAIGEYGHQPCVQVWNVAGSPQHVAELKAHKFGIECMAFSLSMKYVVSVGYQHDRHIHVWNWRKGRCVATSKITSKVYELSFSEDGKYFVTVGNRRVRYWNMFSSTRDDNHTAPLKGQSAILGDLQDNCFVAVECGHGSVASFTYVLTRSGILCRLDQDRALDKFVNVQASTGRSLALCESYVACGCGGGVVRLFDPRTLTYLHTLSLPYPLGVNVAVSLATNQLQQEVGKFPDTVAMALDSANMRLSVVYSDHSHYVWDISNLRQTRKLYSSLHHSACIWDLCLYPSLPSSTSVLPVSCLVTCSSDNTIRFWSMDTTPHTTCSSPVKKIFSKLHELVRVIYANSDHSSLSDSSTYPGDASAVADGQRGVSCVQFHPRGHQLATGDRAGNIRVYEMQFMDIVFEVEAHSADILCIEYSPLHNGQQFMCSASQDSLIHVFTIADHYQHSQTIDDHSASITALRFAVRGGLQLVSCGADKSIMFRTLQQTPRLEFQRTSHIVCKAYVYDMDIDVAGKHMVTASQDRILRVYQLSTGKQMAVIKASTGDEVSLMKVAIDPSGLYVAASSSDRSVYLFDFYSGECLAKLYGHSEVVTQVKFSNDCKFLYSVSGDGCIFIWRLSMDITQTMHERLTEIGDPPGRAPTVESGSSESGVGESGAGEGGTSEDGADADAQFHLSVGRLAQQQVQTRPSMAQSCSTSALEKAGREEGGEEGGVEGHLAQANRSVGSGFLRRTASEADIAVIDLTVEEDDEVGRAGAAEDQEDEFYPQLTTGIDPRVFKVTTLEKNSQDKVTVQEEEEEEDSDTSGSSSSSSSVDFLKTNVESLSSDQADTFFSRASPAPQDLHLNISACYFTQSSKKSCPSPDLPVPAHSIASNSHPEPPSEETVTSSAEVGMEVAEEREEGEGREEREEERGEGVETVEEVRVRGNEASDGPTTDVRAGRRTSEDKVPQGSKRSPAAEEEIDKTRKRREKFGLGTSCIERGLEAAEEREEGEGVREGGEEREEERGEDVEEVPQGTRRSPAVQEEIGKIRKRLQELGYGVSAKAPAVAASKTEVPTLSVPPPAPHHIPHTVHLTHPSLTSQKKQKPISTPASSAAKSTVDTEESVPDTHTSAHRREEEVSDLLSRVKLCVASINAELTNISTLHQLAVEGRAGCQGEEGGRQKYEHAIRAIATTVHDMRKQSFNLVRRYRRMWLELPRGRGRGKRGSGGAVEEGEGGGAERERRGAKIEGGPEDEGREGEDKVAQGTQKVRETVVRSGVCEGEGGDVMRGQGVSELLDRYSQELVALVRERTAQKTTIMDT